MLGNQPEALWAVYDREKTPQKTKTSEMRDFPDSFTFFWEKAAENHMGAMAIYPCLLMAFSTGASISIRFSSATIRCFKNLLTKKIIKL